MSMKLESQCQAAMDLAKSSIPEGKELDVGLALSALYYGTNLCKSWPALAKGLDVPRPCQTEVPEEVPMAGELELLLAQLSTRPEPVSAEALFGVLLESPAGHTLLASSGIEETEIAAVLAALRTTAKSSWRNSDPRREAVQALAPYGRMLTDENACQGGMVEKEDTIRALVRVLCKRKRRNVIVIGPPGTGKSALIYELSSRLARGDASLPMALRDTDVYEMSPTFIKAGASVVGQFEERMKNLIQVLEANQKIILFVDELHSFFQTGLDGKGPFSDAGDIMKGALSRGKLTCIGCTTSAEYRHYIEPDGALARRFSLITLAAPSADETIRILKSKLPRLENFYAPLSIPEAILERVVSLTEEHLPSRFQPDKSIQLLDEACAYCVTATPRMDTVSEDALWRSLEDTIGHSVVRTRTLTEESVYEELARKIVGQDEVLRGVARAFVTGLGGWTQGSGPRGVFLFGGPTGVGKTETALELARILGGDRDTLVRVDCNTLQGSGYDGGPAINRLLGVPPGYIGYARGRGGILSRVRDCPETVVLFDEFEKAPRAVGELLLQILDKARVEDVDGNILDFGRAFVVFTTNAGCVYDKRQPIGYLPDQASVPVTPEVDEDRLKQELGAMGLGQEFLGRIGHFFLFNGLDQASIRTVVEGQIKKLQAMAEERNLSLSWSPKLVDHLASQWQPRFGVRHLATILLHRVAEQLSVAEAQGELREATEVRLEVMQTPDDADDLDLSGLAVRETEESRLVIRLA